MLMMQLLLSWRPLRKTFSSRESSSLKNRARSCSSSCWILGLGGFRLGLAQLHHDVEIFELLLRLEERLGLVAEGVGLVDELLGLLAVVPEVLRRHQGVDFAQAFLRAGHVKETSADGPVYRRRWPARL